MGTQAGIRTNEQWLADLRSEGNADAVGELSQYLRRGLSKAMAGRAEISQADIDDFAQDAVMRVLQRLDSYRADARFTTWAMAVAVRVAFTALRRRRWGNRSLEDLGLSVESAVVQPDRRPADPPGVSERHEVLAALREAIERDLTPRQRAAILAELAGMPTAVIAEQLGINPNALYKLHHDGRKRLRKALERAGFRGGEVSASLEGASKK